jgi:hypothetical protein
MEGSLGGDRRIRDKEKKRGEDVLRGLKKGLLWKG